MRISLVVPTYNRAQLLDRHLFRTLLERGTFPNEIIIVDDGSSDHTRTVCDVFRACGMPIVYVYNHSPHVSNRCHATNVGIKQATGDYIMQTDPEVEFVTNIVAQYREAAPFYPNDILAPEVGYHEPHADCELEDCFVAREGNGLHGNGGNVFMYRKEWIEAIGGWDESLKPGGFDDIDFHNRLASMHHVQVPVPGTVIRHCWHPLLPWNAGQEENSLDNKRVIEAKRYPEDVIANVGKEWGCLV